jgi:hypothetical protein
VQSCGLRPLSIEDVKPRLLGRWGTTSGLNFQPMKKLRSPRTSAQCSGTAARMDRVMVRTSTNNTLHVPATRLVIASTAAMLIVRHEAPCRYIGLSLPNRIMESQWRIGNSRQVSGTGDAVEDAVRGLSGYSLARTKVLIRR